MIEAHRIGMRMGKRWLWRNLSFRIERGSRTAIIGPNGVGKSTLIRALTGLCPTTEGQVHRKASIGYVPQRSAIAMDFTVQEVVAMARSARKGLFSRLDRLDRVAIAKALAATGMADFAERSFQRLSGGERQMVLIARALASEAQVLILDEPCASLDLYRQGDVLNCLGRLAAEGMAVLFSTHDPDHAFAIASTTLTLSPTGGWTTGPTRTVLTAETLSALYRTPVSVIDHQHDIGIQRHMLTAFTKET
jgi:iron complex transport system ATP-binding protein